MAAKALGYEADSLGLVQVQAQDLVPAVCRAARSLLQEDDWRFAIPQILADVGGTAQASRAYLLRRVPLEPASRTVLLRLLNEWRPDDGREDCKPGPREWRASDEAMQGWMVRYQAGEPVCGIVNHFKPVERQFLLMQDVASVALFPLLLDGRLWGAVGFDDCRRRVWREADLVALRGLSDILSAAIERQPQTEAAMAVA